MDVRPFLEGYPAQVQAIFLAATQAITEIMPEATQQVDTSANLLAFNLMPGYKGTVFTLLPAKTHVTLGIYNGATLEDPTQILTGSGKVHRHIKLRCLDEVNASACLTLIRLAIHKARERLTENRKERNV